MATTNAQFCNVLGHNEGCIPDNSCQPLTIYSGQFLAIAKAQFGSAICNNQSISRKYCWQPRKCYSGASIRERSGNSQGIIRECHWLPQMCNSNSQVAVAMALSWIMCDHRQAAVLKCHWQPPKQHSAKALIIARATFGSIPGNSRGAILEHHWQ